ncbi:hypothetical protein QNI19_37950 [Cytophagaceae bacterium DM2B3-1]|uniref:Uncharacterized protein n=1 Tax=Xanthocytophaga flava TaxID=3048013 RepID=A0ABT7CYE8_9BACT|nr:hypothetical protein [Xanthocytophaga flavus]MDJ1498778.1 hypothetical protein [Xanthocytophaga flavus]
MTSYIELPYILRQSWPPMGPVWEVSEALQAARISFYCFMPAADW